MAPSPNDDVSLLIAELKKEHVDADEGRTFKTMAFALKSHAGDGYKEQLKQAGAQSSYCKHDYPEWFERLWKFDANGNVAKPITVGSFYYYARQLLGDQVYFKIKLTGFPRFDIGLEQHMATSFINVLGCDWIRVNAKNYCFTGLVWREDNDKDFVLHDHIEKNLFKYYAEQYQYLSRKLKAAEDAQDEGEQKKIQSQQSFVVSAKDWCKDVKKRDIIIRNISRALHMQNLKDKVELDANELTFYFNNACFDLATSQQLAPAREDYVTLTTSYNWVQPTPEQMANMQTLFEQIFPVQEERNLYCKLLASAFTGRQLDKFTVANGSGGNGKSVIHDLVEATLEEGVYSHRMTEATLTKGQKDDKCADLAALNKVRFAIAAEPSETDGGFQKSVITKLTGCSKLCARALYSNDTQVTLCDTLFVECNQKLPLLGRMDDAWARRLIDFPFRATFTEKPAEFHGDHVYKANKYYTTNQFRKEYRCVLFLYLLPHIKELAEKDFDISDFIPQSIRDRGAIYMEDSDPMKQWIDANYKRTGEPTHWLQIADMFDMAESGYKWSDLYINLNKADKRKQTLKWFKETISGNMFVKRDYKEYIQPTINGERKKKRNVLIGWVPRCATKRDEEEDDED